MKIVTLKTGNWYPEHDYVGAFHNSLKRHLTVPFEFACLTKSSLPSWWGKMDIFKAGGPIIYSDLDMVICGNVDFLSEYQGEFCARENPWQGAWCDAGLMSLSADACRHIAEAFFKAPQDIMRQYRSDQEFIGALVPPADTWQKLFPGKTSSFKADNLTGGPEGASIVHFHGKPKPHQLTNLSWVKEHWN